MNTRGESRCHYSLAVLLEQATFPLSGSDSFENCEWYIFCFHCGSLLYGAFKILETHHAQNR